MVDSPERSARRAAIYRTGVELFLQYGFERASMRELARRVGIGLGTIYTYYPGKDAILMEFLEETVDRLSGLVADIQASDLPADVQLRRLVLSHLHYLARNARVTRLLFIDSQHLQPEAQSRLVQERNRYHRLVGELVAAGQQEGSFRPDLDPDWAATAILGAVGAVIAAWLGQQVRASADEPLPDLDEMAAAAYDLVCLGLYRRTVRGVGDGSGR